MKELNDDMDNLFRESLDSSEINPSQAVWNSIEQRLNQQQAISRRKKRLLYLWYAVPVIILCAAAAQYFLAPFNPGILKDTNPNSYKELSRVPALNKTQEQISVSTDQTSIVTNSFAGKQTAPEKKKETTAGMYAEEHEQKASVRDKVPGKNTLFAVNNEVPVKDVNTSEVSSQAPAQAPEVSSTLPESDAEKSSVDKIAPVNVTAVQEKKEDSALPQNSNTNKTAADSLKTSPDQETASLLTRPHRLSVQFFYAPELTKRVFTKDHDSDDNLKMNDDDYQERELIGPSFSMGLKAGYDLSERWKLHIGLSYYSFSQQIQPLTLFTQKGGDGANHFVLNTSAGSAEIPNKGSEPGKKDSLMLLNPSSQVLHYLNIPLTVEFGIAGFRKFSCYAFAGAYLSYLLDSKLVMEVTKGSVTEVYTFSSLSGMNKFVLGLNAGLGLQYKLSKQWSLHAEPGAKFAVSPLNSNTLVKCYPYSFALTFGLSYHF